MAIYLHFPLCRCRGQALLAELPLRLLLCQTGSHSHEICSSGNATLNSQRGWGNSGHSHMGTYVEEMVTTCIPHKDLGLLCVDSHVIGMLTLPAVGYSLTPKSRTLFFELMSCTSLCKGI